MSTNTTLTATTARANLYQIIEQVGASHVPVHIHSKKNNVVLVSEDDWRAMQETVYLCSIPGMRQSIKKGLKTPIEQCDTEINW